MLSSKAHDVSWSAAASYRSSNSGLHRHEIEEDT